MNQILNKKYFVKFHRCRLQLTLIGANFDYGKGQITGWKELPLPENG